MTDVWAEPRSRQTKLLPPVGDDVTASSQSKGVDHLEKVTTRKTAKAAALAILRMWRRRQPTPSDDDVTVQDACSGEISKENARLYPPSPATPG